MTQFELKVEGFRTFSFRALRVTLGRSDTCDLVLPDESLEPVHAALYEARGRFFIEREVSHALTFLNHVPVQGLVEIYDGDRIDVGPYTIEFECQEVSRRVDDRLVPRIRRGTPSDVTIIRTRRWDELLPQRTARADDSTTISQIS